MPPQAQARERRDPPREIRGLFTRRDAGAPAARIDVDEHVEREPRRARRRGEFRGVPGIVDH